MKPSVLSTLLLFSGVIFMQFYLAIAAPVADIAIAQVKQADDTKDGNQAMYSYSQAIVGENGKPSISQLTIAKGQDGQLHYAKSQNGTIKTGKWEGPLPSAPDTKSLGESLNSLSSGFADPLTILNQSIGNTVQEYLLQALKF